MRILTTTRWGASRHPIAMTTAPTSSLRSDHGRATSPAIPVYGGPQASSRGLSVASEPDAIASTIPLTALRHTASTDGEVNA